jgi:hypothetical protein
MQDDIWKAKTTYKKGDIVYPSVPNGFYYKCIKPGISDFYKRNYGGDEPEWPTSQGDTIEDFTVVWEAASSIQYAIPKDLRGEELYIEVYKVLDYLLREKDEMYYDARNKFCNRYNISSSALESFISEQGYKYITDVLSLPKEKLLVVADFLNLIHFLKGTKEGLELILDLLGIVYVIKEWWEKDPKGEPYTFSLNVDFNLSTIKRDSADKIQSFVRHYVFPKLEELVINYQAYMAAMEIGSNGVVDVEIEGEVAHNALAIPSITGVIDQTIVCETVIPGMAGLTLDSKVVVLPENKIFVLL